MLNTKVPSLAVGFISLTPPLSTFILRKLKKEIMDHCEEHIFF